MTDTTGELSAPDEEDGAPRDPADLLVCVTGEQNCGVCRQPGAPTASSAQCLGTERGDEAFQESGNLRHCRHPASRAS